MMDKLNEPSDEMGPSNSVLMSYYEADQIDEMKDYIRNESNNGSLNYQDLINLAKSGTDAASLVKELILLHQLDETELADVMAKEIVRDLEHHIDEHLKRFEKYTLNAPQMSSDVDKSKSEFYNLISLLRDVSILARKLLEASLRFDTTKPGTPQVPNLDQTDQNKMLNAPHRDTKSQMSEDDATSDDQLAALIESSSSDDFLVLSSSVDSITIRDMLRAAFILITSHECFTLSHDIQGVAMVLRRTKFMIKNILAPKNQMELIIRLLTSIGRFNEMNYVFDLFRDRNQFEILLSKGVEKTPELRIALFNYVKKNPEFYALVTLNFSMFREIAESLESSASKRLDKLIQIRRSKRKMSGIVSVRQQLERRDSDVVDDKREHIARGFITKSNSIGTNLSSLVVGVSGDTSSCPPTEPDDCERGNNKPLYSKDGLNMCLVEMVDASECFAKAGCYKRSNICESKAKLIALQLALLRSGTNVLGLQPSELCDTIVSFESFSNAFIVAEAYDYHLSWRQALFRNVVLRGQSLYLRDYLSVCELTTTLVMELVTLFKRHVAKSNNEHHLSHDEVTKLAAAMKSIIACHNDVELKCKLYTQLNLIEARDELLQNPSIKAHLQDLRLI